MPLLSALLIGRPTAAMFLLAAAAVAGFFSYEPLLVLLGYRGAKLRAEAGRRARRQFALLCGLSAVLGLGAIVSAPAAARWALAVPAVPMLAMVVLLARKMATGRAGEIVAAVALSSVSVPVVVFGGASGTTALVVGIVWVTGFTSLNLAVRALLDRGRGRGFSPTRVPAMIIIVALWAAVAAAAWGGGLPWVVPVALAPLAACGLVILILFPRPQRVAVLGWSAVAASVMTAVLLVALCPPVA